MPYELTWEPRGVYRRYFGHVTIAERRESLERICADGRFDRVRYTITDSLAVESYEVSDEDTRETAALHVGPLFTNPNIVMAAVAVDERVIAAVRHFMSLGFTRQPYRLFSTVAEAREWIEQTPWLRPAQRATPRR
jgi:hypothetical protein